MFLSTNKSVLNQFPRISNRRLTACGTNRSSKIKTLYPKSNIRVSKFDFYEYAWTHLRNNTLISNENSPVDSILFSEKEIQARIEELGAHIAHDYADKRPLLISTLSGAFMFTADLIRAIKPIPKGMEVDFIKVSSYGNNKESCGHVEISGNPKLNIKDRNIIILEDIVDTGQTISELRKYLIKQEINSVNICTLLDKETKRTCFDLQPNYVGFKCPDEFVVGYGLDVAEEYRSYPFIFRLKKSHSMS